MTGALEDQRCRAAEYTNIVIETLARDEIDVRDDEAFACQESCTYLDSRFRMLVLALIDWGLWPVTGLSHMPLGAILGLMERNEIGRFKEQEAKLQACSSGCVRNVIAVDAVMLQDKLRDAARRIRDDVKGLCYRCVREGKTRPGICAH